MRTPKQYLKSLSLDERKFIELTPHERAAWELLRYDKAHSASELSVRYSTLEALARKGWADKMPDRQYGFERAKKHYKLFIKRWPDVARQ